MATKSTAAPDTHTLRVERRFQSSPERVFQAWTSPEEMSQWSSPDAAPAEVQMDVRVGGRYRMAMAAPGGAVHRVTGTYREVEVPRRLVYTWRWESIADFPDTIVTVDFRRSADGGTEVLLVHEGLPDSPSGRRHEFGWAASLGKLDALMTREGTQSSHDA